MLFKKDYNSFSKYLSIIHQKSKPSYLFHKTTFGKHKTVSYKLFIFLIKSWYILAFFFFKLHAWYHLPMPRSMRHSYQLSPVLQKPLLLIYVINCSLVVYIPWTIWFSSWLFGIWLPPKSHIFSLIICFNHVFSNPCILGFKN